MSSHDTIACSLRIPLTMSSVMSMCFTTYVPSEVNSYVLRIVV